MVCTRLMNEKTPAETVIKEINNNNNLILETAHTTKVSMLFTIKNYTKVYMYVYIKRYIYTDKI